MLQSGHRHAPQHVSWDACVCTVAVDDGVVGQLDHHDMVSGDVVLDVACLSLKRSETTNP